MVTVSREKDINIEFDEETQDYYIIWQPMVIVAAGKSKHDALEDLREAAHFGIDTLIDLKSKDISIEKED